MFIQKLLLILAWAPQITKLLPLPKITDPEKTRLWGIKFLDVVDPLAEQTPTEIDDMLVDAGQQLTADAASWAAVHAFLMKLFVSGSPPTSLPSATDDEIVAVADKAGISPAVLILIIEAAMKVFDWWRDRKQTDAGALPPTENID